MVCPPLLVSPADRELTADVSAASSSRGPGIEAGAAAVGSVAEPETPVTSPAVVLVPAVFCCEAVEEPGDEVGAVAAVAGANVDSAPVLGAGFAQATTNTQANARSLPSTPRLERSVAQTCRGLDEPSQRCRFVTMVVWYSEELAMRRSTSIQRAALELNDGRGEPTAMNLKNH